MEAANNSQLKCQVPCFISCPVKTGISIVQLGTGLLALMAPIGLLVAAKYMPLSNRKIFQNVGSLGLSIFVGSVLVTIPVSCVVNSNAKKHAKTGKKIGSLGEELEEIDPYKAAHYIEKSRPLNFIHLISGLATVAVLVTGASIALANHHLFTLGTAGAKWNKFAYVGGYLGAGLIALFAIPSIINLCKDPKAEQETVPPAVQDT